MKKYSSNHFKGNKESNGGLLLGSRGQKGYEPLGWTMCAAFNDMYSPKLVFAHSVHPVSRSDWIVKYPSEAKQA